MDTSGRNEMEGLQAEDGGMTPDLWWEVQLRRFVPPGWVSLKASLAEEPEPTRGTWEHQGAGGKDGWGGGGGGGGGGSVNQCFSSSMKEQDSPNGDESAGEGMGQLILPVIQMDWPHSPSDDTNNEWTVALWLCRIHTPERLPHSPAAITQTSVDLCFRVVT